MKVLHYNISKDVMLRFDRRRPSARFFFPAVFLAAILSAFMFSSVAAAQSNSTTAIGMFPQEMTDLAYMNFKAVRKLSWFAYGRDQLLPTKMRQFDAFLGSVGLDPNSVVDEAYWGEMPGSSGGQQILGIALGQFDPSSIQNRLDGEKIPSIDVHGFSLYAFGTGSGSNDILFTFLDSNTAAFGSREALEALIDVRTGARNSVTYNRKLFPLIDQVKGTAAIWSVFNQDYARQSLQRFAPEVNKFPEIKSIQERVAALTLTIDVDDQSETEISSHIVCGSSDDANLLAAALQAALMYRRYQASSASPGISPVLDEAKVTARGNQLQLTLNMTADQLQAFVMSKAANPGY